MSHSCSMAHIKQLEHYLDLNIKVLVDKISIPGAQGDAFDLKKLIQNYAIDVLGELAFTKSFKLQETGDESGALPVAAHSLLKTANGAWPSVIKTLKKWLCVVSLDSLQRLFEGRQKVIQMAAD